MIGTRLIGLSVCQQELRAVVLKKSRRRLQVVGWERQAWSSPCLKPSFSEKNVFAKEGFISDVRLVLQTLKFKNGPIALSLSDKVGFTFVTILNNPLKRGQEGINFLKWHLRNHFPFDMEYIRLVYQVIAKDSEGKVHLLVTATHNEVLEQYEKLLVEIGLVPATVLLDSLSMMNYFHRRSVTIGHHLRVFFSQDTLSLHLLCDSRLLACRSRPAPNSERDLYQEIIRTLTEWERTWPQSRNVQVYLHAPSETDAWKEGFERSLGLPVQKASIQPLPIDSNLQKHKFKEEDFCSAIGAAEHLGRFIW